MKTFAAFFFVLFTAHILVADAYSSAIRQARNAANGGNRGSQQNNPPPSAPPQSNPPPDPVLEATLRNIANLRADFENFADGQTNRQPLIIDLTAAAQGAKAQVASISGLADHLAAIITGNKKLAAQEQKLAQNVHAIFNSSHLSAAQQQMVCDSVQKILLAGGASSDDVANVINDLKTIATETK